MIGAHLRFRFYFGGDGMTGDEAEFVFDQELSNFLFLFSLSSFPPGYGILVGLD